MSLTVNLSETDDRTRRMNKSIRLLVAKCQINSKILPYIKYLEFWSTYKFLEDIYKTQDLHKKRFQDSPNPYHGLRLLHSGCDNQDLVTAENLELATVLCPAVVKVCIANINIPNDSLFLLTRYQHLQELEIGNGAERTINFDEGVLPVLQVVGLPLTVLSLAELPDVDVTAIGWCCPNLQKFNLLMNVGFLSAAGPKAEYPFGHLRTCRIVCSGNCDIPSPQLKQILSHCYGAQSLLLKDCQNLTDEVLSDVLNCNPLPQLCDIEIEQCDKLTAASVMTLLSLDNKLRSIKLWNCKSITCTDFQFIRDLIKQENLNIKIEWT